MIFIITGSVAFGFFYIFDINKLKPIHKWLNFSFALGVLLLAISSVGVLVTGESSFTIYWPLALFFYFLSLISLVLMIYALFYALPFKKTYVEVEEKNPVVDKGMYALCRHPGVLWFFLVYFFLWLGSGNILVMWACIIWTIMDVIHVYVQDRWLFPKTLANYDRYRRKVPFLIPNIKSAKRFVITIR